MAQTGDRIVILDTPSIQRLRPEAIGKELVVTSTVEDNVFAQMMGAPEGAVYASEDGNGPGYGFQADEFELAA